MKVKGLYRSRKFPSFGLRSKSGKTDETEIRAFADQNIKPRLLSVAGVAQVVTTGGAVTGTPSRAS